MSGNWIYKPTEKWHQLHRSLLQGWPWNWGDGRVPRGLPMAPGQFTGFHPKALQQVSSRKLDQPQQARCSLLYRLAVWRHEQVKLYHWTVEEPGMMCWINAQRSRNLTPFPCHFPVPIRSSILNQSICGFPAIYLLGRKSDFRSVSLKCTHSSS